MQYLYYMKPENNFINGVHKYIDKNIVYYEKMCNPYNSGTPDVYYDGPGGDIWIEYKFKQKIPKHYTPAVTELQRQWLLRADNNGRTVYVITGTPQGAIIHRRAEWDMKRRIVSTHLITGYKTRRELAEWIMAACTHLHKSS